MHSRAAHRTPHHLRNYYGAVTRGEDRCPGQRQRTAPAVHLPRQRRPWCLKTEVRTASQRGLLPTAREVLCCCPFCAVFPNLKLRSVSSRIELDLPYSTLGRLWTELSASWVVWLFATECLPHGRCCDHRSVAVSRGHLPCGRNTGF